MCLLVLVLGLTYLFSLHFNFLKVEADAFSSTEYTDV